MLGKAYYVYIMASKKNGTLYIGVSNDLVRRVYEHRYEHRNDLIKGFTKKYGIHSLVYCEETGEIGAAIHRGKQLKERDRKWKLALTEHESKLERPLERHSVDLMPGFNSLTWKGQRCLFRCLCHA